MKKYILAAALVLASTSAMADRVVSGSSSPLVEYDSKAGACEGAKRETLSSKRDSEQVEGYSKCDCDQNSNGKWNCSVDARLEKR
jgi:hypothetical protein